MYFRQDTAYFMPSAVFVGIGFHEAISSIHLLVTKAGAASRTPIWRVSLVVWCFLICFLLFQFIALDFQISPYVVPNAWVGQMYFGNFFFHMLTSIGVSIMLLMRIRIFYSKKSGIYRAMMVLAVLFWISNTAGDVLGLMTSINLMNNKYLLDFQDPTFALSRLILAIGFCFEAAFTAVGSIAFLYALAKGSNKSTAETLFRVIFKKDGLNLLAIVGINLVIAVFALASLFFGLNFVFRTCLVLPSWSYGLQFSTFLKDSYVSAKKIVQENTESQARETSLNYSSTDKKSSGNTLA